MACMKMLLLYCSLLTWTICHAASLQTVVVGRSGDMSCLGDIIQFTCTGTSVVHSWTMPISASVTTVAPTSAVTPPVISINATATDGTLVINSTLTIMSSSELNNTLISCSVDGVVQEATVNVFGPPTPELMATPAADMMSFDFAIIPSDSSVCVNNYTVTANGSDDSSRSFTMSSDDFPLNFPGLAVCTTTYSFTVIAVASGYNDIVMRSPSVGRGTQGVGRITGLEITATHLQWSQPDAPADCYPQYVISHTIDPSGINLTVNTTMIAIGDLQMGGIRSCVLLSLTVTPVLFSGDLLMSSSATINGTLNDPSVVEPPPSGLNVSSMPESQSVLLSWERAGSEGGRFVIRLNSVDVNTVPGNIFEYVVPLDCIYDGTTVNVSVQYAVNGCSTMPNSISFEVNIRSLCVTTPSMSPSTETTTQSVAESSNVAAVAGGVGGGVVAIVAVVVIIIVVLVLCKKKANNASKKGIDGNVKVSYHSAGPAPPLEMSDPTPGGMYADPKAIEHEAAGQTGDEYALVTSNTKGKKKANQPEAAVNVGDMYSVPDKSRKTQNQGLVYADIDVSRPPQRAAPQAPHGMPQQQPDNEPVTYATVAV